MAGTLTTSAGATSFRFLNGDCFSTGSSNHMMAGTLTTFAGATSFRFLNGECFSTANSIGSTSKVYIGVRNVPKASIHAVIEESVMEATKKMKSRSLYDVLRVKRNATQSEIKSAYRSLAKRYHPDAYSSSSSSSDSDQNDDRDFIDIRNAYETLSDPSTRALYDLKLSTGLKRRSGGGGNGIRRSSEFYSCRRWETDQCW